MQFLLRKGLRPVAQNFRCRGGEIDLIMLHGNCLAFIEVRYRRSVQFSSPAATVDRSKQGKILRTAAYFLASEQRYAEHTTRFDVVAVIGETPDGIRWIQDAFRPDHSAL